MKRFFNFICILTAICLTLGSMAVPVNAQENDNESKVYEEVPQYFQDDYPHTGYGNGTVGTSGCGITCLAMVASYLSDTEYLPDELAKRFGGLGGGNMLRMEKASNSLDIPSYEKIYNWDEVMEALDRGNVLIALMDENSLFTDSQHFIVLTGLTDNGRILVNDPNKENYSDQTLLSGFENGFCQPDIEVGFSGAWAYKKEPKAAEEETKTVCNEVPLYFQTDYPHTRYGNGTIATSGCSVTSLAMVASFMTNHEYYPYEIVEYCSHFNGNHMERLEYGSDLLQLSWRKAENFHVALQALRNGSVVIALMNEQSIFTTGQHFIVLTGINEAGKITVNDPNEKNYSHWQLKNGFIEGFSENDIIRGFSGAWIYDKCEMSPEPFIYTVEKVDVEPRYPEISLTADEMDLLAKIVWVEARGETYEGQQAVAEVVFNRMVSGDFPDTVKKVVSNPEQFPSISLISKAEPDAMQYDAIESALYGPYVLPMEVVFYAQFAVNDNIWGTIGGHTFCYDWDWIDCLG